MTQAATVISLTDASTRRVAPLAPGLHAARMEEPLTGQPGLYHVRLAHGDRIVARLSDDIEPAFAEECCRDRRRVLVTPAPEGCAVVVGALQTSRSTSRDAHDTLRLEARRLELEAEEGITVRVGKAILRLDRNGSWKMVGNKMTIDIASVVRVLSSLVELP